ncbi:MAG: DUF5702 domain-containing protein [Helcococcus sp.]|nr:DUF5702 domain-containing protein [Helcococcus sp.]
MKRKIDGFISIFLALIILPIYSFAILTIDVVKIITAINDTKLVNEIALESTLSNYNRDLYEKYRIFGIDKSKEFLDEYVNNIIESNLENNNSRFYKLNHVNSTVNLNNETNLLISDDIQNQIIDYMNTHGPYEISKGVLNLLDLVKLSKKYTNAIEKKIDYEEEYSKIDLSLNKISEYFVKYNAEFEEINNGYNDLNKRLNTLITDSKEYFDLKESQEILNKESKNELNKDEEKLKEIIKKIQNKIKEYNEKNKKFETKLASQQVNINEIITLLKIFYNQTVSLEKALANWGNEIEKLENSAIKNNFKSDYKSMKLQFTRENIESILNKILAHENTLTDNIKNLKESNAFYIDIKEFNKDIKFDLTKITKLPSLNNYKLYKYINDRSTALEFDKEARKKAKNNKNELERLLDNYDDIKDTKEFGNINDFIDFEKFIDLSNNSEIVATISSSKKYKDAIKQSNNIINYNDTNLIENLYLALYIVNNFGNKLDSDDNFSSQIEYILFGNQNLKSNVSSVENSIFAIRLLLNSIYAYTNADLGREATAIATAIAGWTGFGVPILRTIILSMMSISESAIDVNTINKNQYLESYKNKATWQVSIGGLSNLLSKELKEITSNTIDNIYEYIQNYTNEGVEYLNDKLNEFTKQTIDGVAQTVISEMINPIQSIIANNINNPINDLKSQINESFNTIQNNIYSSSDKIKSIKIELFNYIKDTVTSQINSINEINFQSYFNELVVKVENMINEKTSDITNNFKSNIQDFISDNKLDSKIKINEIIDRYILEMGGKKTYINGSNSGLSFKYRDYLTLVAFFRINIDKKSVLNRMTFVMDYELKKKNPGFNIMNIITNVEINSNTEIDVSLLSKYIKLEKISESISGGY